MGGSENGGGGREKNLNEDSQLSDKVMTSRKRILSFKEFCTERGEKR